MNNTNNSDYLKSLLPNDDILAKCIHCGLCLTACPTYELTKLERSSPRGRIRLINAVSQGVLPVTEVFADEMDFCLDCQACETACPAGVQYGLMVESARVVVDESQINRKKLVRFLKKSVLRYIVAKKNNLKLISKLLSFYQFSGAEKFVRRTNLLNLFSGKLGKIEKLLPVMSNKFSDEIIPEVSYSNKNKKYKTVFLTGCLMNVMFADINLDTIKVLTELGCDTITPKDQVCCGSLHAHNGDIKTAVNLAKKNIDVFTRYEYDFLISNSAGCGAFMKQYGHFLKDDNEYADKAKLFSQKVKDITEFICENKFEAEWGRIDETVTYHDACHLVHSQKIYNQPREVLKKIPGLIVKELNESTACCGSAGIYNVLRYNDSIKILEKKMKNISDTEAKIVVTGNPGCISQIKNGGEMFSTNVKVLHPVTLILQSLLNAKS